MKILLVLLSFLCSGLVIAGEEQKSGKESPLRFGLSGSVIQASGNTHALTAGGHGFVSYKTDGYTIGTEVSYLRVEGDQANEKSSASLALERKLGRISPYGQGSYERDLSSGILGQRTLEAGVLYALVDGDSRWLKLSQALAETSEEQLGRTPPSEQFWGSKSGVMGRWPIKPLAFRHKTYYIKSFRDGADWRMSHTTALVIDISYLELEISYSMDYRHRPAQGKKQFDQTTLFSIGVVWPRKDEQ